MLAAGWGVLKAEIGTVVFFDKLAILAVLVGPAIRAWVRGAQPAAPPSRPSRLS